ncbi:MAG: hypothetical protein L6R45_20870 [Anaerolineae bacterium]|nr:hypothetical protein [Anaerolineae bacterium]
MKVVKAPAQLFQQIMDLYIPKNEQERRVQATSATIIALLAAAALLYSYFI